MNVVNKNKSIYLITTYKCSACKLQKHLLEKVLENRKDIKLEERDFSNTPDFIKTWVELSDFPTTVFVEDENIKYNFVGTKSVNNITKIMNDINF